MNDAPSHDAVPAASSDPVTASPRDLMQTLLPEARRLYINAWEILADASTPLDRRREIRARAAAIADGHAAVVAVLREREPKLTGDDLLNARHLATELERHAEAVTKLSTISPLGLAQSQTLRPEALGCGKKYRDTAKESAAGGSASRNVRSTSGPKARDAGGPRQRGADQPFSDRGPKVSRDALGSSKHDSSVGDDLDPETRAKLEAMRKALEG